MKNLIIAAAMLSSSVAFADISGDVTGGATILDKVQTDNGWITNSAAGNAVDFWTFTAKANDTISITIASDIDFGISVYQGKVSDSLGYAFQNNADFMDPITFTQGKYIAGNNGVFGEVGSKLLNVKLTEAGVYTIAVGGDLGFGAEGPYNYAMCVHQVEEVPLPAAAWLFGSALAGLVARKKK